MKNKKTIFLIGVMIFLAIILIYSLKSPQVVSRGVSVVGVKAVMDSSGAGGPDGSDEIVKIISTLSKVDLKTDFFEDQLFLSLEDSFVSPVEGETGRKNPFAAY